VVVSESHSESNPGQKEAQTEEARCVRRHPLTLLAAHWLGPVAQPKYELNQVDPIPSDTRHIANAQGRATAHPLAPN